VLLSCAGDPPHFRDSCRDRWVSWLDRLLAPLDEPAPDDEHGLVRFVWRRAFHGVLVFTVASDGDVGVLRYRYRAPLSDRWEQPKLVFLEPEKLSGLLHDVPTDCQQEGSLAVAGGSLWAFEGDGWAALSRSPRSGTAWFDYGMRCIRQAQLELGEDEIYQALDPRAPLPSPPAAHHSPPPGHRPPLRGWLPAPAALACPTPRVRPLPPGRATPRTRTAPWSIASLSRTRSAVCSTRTAPTSRAVTC
jgi:hypothetical protein